MQTSDRQEDPLGQHVTLELWSTSSCAAQAVVQPQLATSASCEQTGTPSPWRRLWAGLALSLASSWMRLSFPQPPQQSLSQSPAVHSGIHLPWGLL